MLRTFGIQTLGATAQPWFADVLTAAAGATPNPGVNNPASRLQVASTLKYRVGDHLILDPGLVNAERVDIIGILSSTVLQVSSQNKAHANGAVIQLAISAFNVSIQSGSMANVILLGTDGNITIAPSGNIIAQILPSNTWNYASSFGYDGVDAVGWIVGTPGDTYIATAYVV